jgi:uncharacterized protein (DUF1501 family)
MSHHHDDHHDHDHDHAHEDVSRRSFLRTASLGLITAMAGGFGLPGIAIGQTAGVRKKTLVKVFMRGGADTLHLFPAVGDAAYYRVRANVNIKPPSSTDAGSALRLTNRFGLNPNLAPLMEIWDAGRLAIAMSTHFAEGNRSHFDCQRWIEAGKRDDNSIDGALNRYLQTQTAPGILAGIGAGTSNLPLSLRGPVSVGSVSSSSSVSLTNNDLCSGTGCADNRLTTELLNIVSRQAPGAATSTENVTRKAERIMLESSSTILSAAASYVGATGSLSYSNSTLGRGLKLVAQLLKANVPVQVAALDWNNGWDTHENLLPAGQDPISQTVGYQSGLRAGASDLVAFYRDLGPLLDDVIVVVGSEFGRTVKENGTFGTDHGHGGAWFSFGGQTRGGVYGEFGSLDPADNQLLGGNFLPVVMNYKDIIAEIMVRHLGMNTNLVSTIFPGHTFTNYNLFSRTA